MAKKWTLAKDKADDKKRGIKEGSARDNALDKKRGVPTFKAGGMVRRGYGAARGA